MVSMQKSGLKNMHWVLRHYPRCVKNWPCKRNKKIWHILADISGLFFNTDVCVEIICPSRLIWIPWTMQLERFFSIVRAFLMGSSGRSSRCPRSLTLFWYLQHGDGIGKQSQSSHFALFDPCLTIHSMVGQLVLLYHQNQTWNVRHMAKYM